MKQYIRYKGSKKIVTIYLCDICLEPQGVKEGRKYDIIYTASFLPMFICSKCGRNIKFDNDRKKERKKHGK